MLPMRMRVSNSSYIESQDYNDIRLTHTAHPMDGQNMLLNCVIFGMGVVRCHMEYADNVEGGALGRKAVVLSLLTTTTAVGVHRTRGGD